jgi:hypothetical protein
MLAGIQWARAKRICVNSCNRSSQHHPVDIRCEVSIAMSMKSILFLVATTYSLVSGEQLSRETSCTNP